MSAATRIFEEMGFAVQGERREEAVIYSLARTASLLLRELSKVYAKAELTAASFNLLMLLKHGKDPETMTQHEIGRRLAVSPSDMTGLIDRLERRSLVRRQPGKDRRVKLLEITPQGKRLLDEVWPGHLSTIKQRCACLDASKARRLVEALAALREALA